MFLGSLLQMQTGNERCMQRSMMESFHRTSRLQNSKNVVEIKPFFNRPSCRFSTYYKRHEDVDDISRLLRISKRKFKINTNKPSRNQGYSNRGETSLYATAIGTRTDMHSSEKNPHFLYDVGRISDVSNAALNKISCSLLSSGFRSNATGFNIVRLSSKPCTKAVPDATKGANQVIICGNNIYVPHDPRQSILLARGKPKKNISLKDVSLYRYALVRNFVRGIKNVKSVKK